MRIMGFLALLLTVTCGSASAEPEYYSAILRKAKSATVFFTAYDAAGCKFGPFVKVTQEGIRKLVYDESGLEVIDHPDANHIPDLGLLFLIEASPTNKTAPDGTCNFLVKTSAYHSTHGYLRYDSEPKIIRILAYETIHYGSSSKSDLEAHVTQTLVSSFGLFLKQLKDARASK